MSGYEKYIVGNVQHIYDWFDWNRELNGIYFLDWIKSNKIEKLLEKFGRYGSTSLAAALEIRNQCYYKPAKCLKCRYYLICDGIEKNVDQSQIKTVTDGELVKDCMKFIKNTTEQRYARFYKK